MRDDPGRSGSGQAEMGGLGARGVGGGERSARARVARLGARSVALARRGWTGPGGCRTVRGVGQSCEARAVTESAIDAWEPRSERWGEFGATYSIRGRNVESTDRGNDETGGNAGNLRWGGGMADAGDLKSHAA